MLFHKTSDFPYEYVSAISGNMSTAEMLSLKSLSMETILITHNEKLLGVFGVLPHSLLSNDASIWAIFPDTSLSSLTVLRSGRKLFLEWAESANYRLNAECWALNKEAQKFARFMGFVPVGETTDIINMLHERTA